MKFKKHIDFSKPWEHKEAWGILTKHYKGGFLEVYPRLEKIGYTLHLNQFECFATILAMQEGVEEYQRQLELEDE